METHACPYTFGHLVVCVEEECSIRCPYYPLQMHKQTSGTETKPEVPYKKHPEFNPDGTIDQPSELDTLLNINKTLLEQLVVLTNIDFILKEWRKGNE